ncbi:MAG: hypothetical protein JJ919_17760 [Henriciella sp.]|nr:hypothetical protein [Henriciella sp.]
MQKSYLLGTLLTSTVILAGCVGNGQTNRAQLAKSTGLETMIFTQSSCPSTDRTNSFTAALFSVLLEPVVTGLIKGAGEKIKEAGEDKVTKVETRLPTHYYNIDWSASKSERSKVDVNTGCITVIHGKRTTTEQREAFTGFESEEFKLALENLREKTTEGGDSKIALSSDVIQDILAPESTFPPQYIPLKHRSAAGDEPDDSDGGDPAPGADKTWLFDKDIRFFGQFEFVAANDGTAVQIRPVQVLFGEKFATSKIGASGKRDLVVTVGFHVPGQGGVGDAFALPSAVFKDVKPNTYLTGSDLENVVSGWFPLAAVPDSSKALMTAWDKTFSDLETLKELKAGLIEAVEDAKDADEKAKQQRQLDKVEDKIAALDKYIDERRPARMQTAPVTISATLTETQEGDKFLFNLGSLISDNAEKIAKPVLDEVDPVKRKESAKADAAAASAEAAQAATLRVSAIELVAAYNVENAKVAPERNEIKVRVAKIKAAEACRKLDEANLFEADCLGL